MKITVDIEAMNARGRKLTATLTGTHEDVWVIINALSLRGWVVIHEVVSRDP